MLGGNHNVSHPGIMGHLHPAVGIKSCGIKLIGDLCIGLDGDPLIEHKMFPPFGGMPIPVACGMGVQPPVQKQTKFTVGKPGCGLAEQVQSCQSK
ncbi:hypothetical protein D3C80_1390270 [compost metagenome]